MHTAVQDNVIKSGQYLVLCIDFSRIERSPDIEVATANLADSLNQSLHEFTAGYAKYLDKSTSGLQLSGTNVVGNLNSHVYAIHDMLRRIHEEGDKSHPLFGVEGVCSSRFTDARLLPMLFFLTPEDLLLGR